MAPLSESLRLPCSLTPRVPRNCFVPDADPEMAYLFRKQLQEADLVCWTKSDIPSDVPSIPGIEGRQLKREDRLMAWSNG